MGAYFRTEILGAVQPESPLTKRDPVDPVAALTRVTNVVGFPITATSASAKPEEYAEHHVIEGTTGAYQDPKARLVYFQMPETTRLQSRCQRHNPRIYTRYLQPL